MNFKFYDFQTSPVLDEYSTSLSSNFFWIYVIFLIKFCQMNLKLISDKYQKFGIYLCEK